MSNDNEQRTSNATADVGCRWYNEDVPNSICGATVTHYSCCFGGPNNGLNVCEEHKCRCKQPARTTSEVPCTCSFDAVCKACLDAAVRRSNEATAAAKLPVYYDAPEAEPCPYKRGNAVVTPDGKTRIVNSIDVRVHVEVGATCSHYRPSDLRFADEQRAQEASSTGLADDEVLADYGRRLTQQLRVQDSHRHIRYCLRRAYELGKTALRSDKAKPGDRIELWRLIDQYGAATYDDADEPGVAERARTRINELFDARMDYLPVSAREQLQAYLAATCDGNDESMAMHAVELANALLEEDDRRTAKAEGKDK